MNADPEQLTNHAGQDCSTPSDSNEHSQSWVPSFPSPFLPFAFPMTALSIPWQRWHSGRTDPSVHGRLRSLRRAAPSIAAYLAIAMAALAFTMIRMRGDGPQRTPAVIPPASTGDASKPYFSLTSNRTYRTTENARVWLNYQGMKEIDFRVYRVNDPAKFFKQLDNPHQMGEEDKQKTATEYNQSPSALETLREVKDTLYDAVRDYLRAQLNHATRQTFNRTLRNKTVDDTRRPLNVADYARVPLLNPDQMVSSWRENLPPLDDYDRRVIPLGKREPGVYLVEAVGGDGLRAYSVAIVTDMAMVNKTTPEGEVVVYAVNRQTGAPRQNVNVEVVRNKRTLASGVTDPGGVFKTKLNKAKAGNEQNVAGETESDSNGYLVMATDQENFAISDLDSWYFSEYFTNEVNYDNLAGYIYTDRPIYRPNQTIYFKGILRQLTANGYSMLNSSTVSVTIEDAKDGKLLQKELPLSSLGTFKGQVDLPDEAPLGSYNITATVGSASSSYYFRVEEYKKPEYKVKVTSPKPFAPVGSTTRFDVDARYFFGAPVANAQVKYYIYRTRYYPYWWRDEEDSAEELGIEEEDRDDFEYWGDSGDVVEENEATLDANGHLIVEFEVPEPKSDDRWDYRYRLSVQVTDSSRRTIDGAASFVGTRGSIVARANPTNYVYFKGDTARIDVKTADYQGHPVSTRVKLNFTERHYEKVTKTSDSGYVYESYESREVLVASADLVTNAEGVATYEYKLSSAGSITIETIVQDGNKKIESPGGYMWVADDKSEWSDWDYYSTGTIMLVPDKKSYRAGETAHVLAMLKTENANLLVTTELMSVMTTRHIEAKGRAIVIDVPIEARYAPNVFLSVSYVENNELYTQDQVLIVPARDKFLDLSIIPNRKEYKPREVASYTILARNSDGSPAAGAEVSFGLVDEAIYSIAEESAGNIRREFYGRRYHRVETSFSTRFRFMGYSGDTPATLTQKSAKPNYQLADFKNDTPVTEPTVRKNFKDTAFWKPDLVTNANGEATVQVKLPDNLTTWRATARAITADTRVGSAVERVISRKNLILRLETPRFATAGDTVTISAIVHNFLKSKKKTAISLSASGGQLLDKASENVSIAVNGEHRVDWRVSVPNTGELKLLAKALTDQESDAVELAIEVLPRGLKQSRGQSTTFSQDTAEQEYSFDLPGNADPRARKLRIEASPSIASTLFGALDYLTDYPYGCTEQTMSRFLPTIIVAQTLKDVKSASISDSNDINSKVQAGLNRLYGFQHGDGGWGWWKDDESDPFMTAYVVDGLTIAKNAGYQIDETRLTRAREKLVEMLDTNKVYGDRPIDLESRAYMIYSLTQSGESDRKYVDELFNGQSGLEPYGRALLALTLKVRNDDERARQVAAEIEKTAKIGDFDVHWESRRRPMLDFSEVNNTEASALSLKALVRINPQSPLLAKAAQWLVANRNNGYWWESTKQTAFAIFALADYLKVSQEFSPDYDLEVYLNDELVVRRHVTPKDAVTAQTFVVNRQAEGVGALNRVRVVKRGHGMLYFSTRLEYYTNDEEIAAQGSPDLQLTREYLRLGLDESGDKPTWKIEPLTTTPKSGDLLVVRLHVTGKPATHLMIEDPIPAGGEQVAKVGGISLDYTENGWSSWFSSREFRDEKTVFFLNYFDGDATFQYAMRVQLPGDYRVAPARVELMYTPTIQANAPSARMRILDK